MMSSTSPEANVNNNKIRVVVADDSALMRKKISEILNSDPDIEVVAVANNGREALEAAHALKPDVITLDVEMPLLNGLDALGYIMSEIPTPCVMISAYTKEGAYETVRALELGAIDFVSKPGGVISVGIDKVGEEIISKVKIAAEVSVSNLRLMWGEKKKNKAPEIQENQVPAGQIQKVFTIASSTGGTQALATILPLLPKDFPAAILITQHMPEGFTKSLADRLNWQSEISVVEAEDKMPIKAGEAIIARGGFHLEVGGLISNPHVILSSKSPQLGVRPCADIMMESAAALFKDRTVGIILTGMGSDGTRGAQNIKSAGGLVIAEDRSTCVVYGMPKSVADAGLVDRVVPLNNVVNEMTRIVNKI